MTAPELVAGQIVGGKFTVRRERTRTGLAATYEAITAPNRGVELKVLSPSLRQRADLDECLQRTMRATNELPSSLALPVLDVGVDQHTGAPFVATELSVTPSLAELVQLCPLASNEVVGFVRNLAVALDAVHARGLVHLMLSPDNVFVGTPPRFEVRLADIGASSLLGLAGIDPRWAAPELGAAPQIACDVYAAALVTLFAVGGAALIDRSEAAMRTPATTIARETGNPVDARLDAPLARALASDPAARYGSVLELAEAVAQAFGMPWAGVPVMRAPQVEAVYEPFAAEAQAPGAVVPGWGPPEPVAPAVAVPSSDMAFASMDPVRPFGDSVPAEAGAAGLPAPKPFRLALVAIGVALGVGAIGALGWTVSHRRVHVAAPTSSASSRPVVAARASSAPATATAPAAAPPDLAVASAVPVAAASAAPVVAASAAPSDGARTARLTVSCTPECDLVTVDGNDVASFPMALEPGDHSVSGRRGQHPLQTKRVTILEGKEETVSFVFMATRAAPKKACGKFLQRCD